MPDGRIILSGKDYHYLVRVRRVKAGDMLNAVLPDSTQAQLTVISAEENALLCGVRRAGEKTPDEKNRGDSGPKIILLQAVSQPIKMDMLVRQSTEGGVYAIVPFVSRYSVSAATASSRLERLRRIVREARQQSGSPVATTVEDVRGGVDEALAYYREARTAMGVKKIAALLLHEKENSADGAFHRVLVSRPDTVFVVIGPEGGFADEETAAFVQNGFTVINMGPNVLRVETAAAWVVGVVSVLLRESVLWELRESRKT